MRRDGTRAPEAPQHQGSCSHLLTLPWPQRDMETRRRRGQTPLLAPPDPHRAAAVTAIHAAFSHSRNRRSLPPPRQPRPLPLPCSRTACGGAAQARRSLIPALSQSLGSETYGCCRSLGGAESSQRKGQSRPREGPAAPSALYLGCYRCALTRCLGPRLAS